MIDFNTILNAVFEAALKPLQDKIEAQEKRLMDMEEFIAKWNFGGEEKFKEAVTEIAKDVAVQFADTLREEMDEKLGEIDVSDAVEKEVTKQMEDLDLEDIVRDILKDATVEIRV